MTDLFDEVLEITGSKNFAQFAALIGNPDQPYFLALSGATKGIEETEAMKVARKRFNKILNAAENLSAAMDKNNADTLQDDLIDYRTEVFKLMKSAERTSAAAKKMRAMTKARPRKSKKRDDGPVVLVLATNWEIAFGEPPTLSGEDSDTYRGFMRVVNAVLDNLDRPTMTRPTVRGILNPKT